VDLTMAQDSWLRGRDLNVEMAGTLDVYWDRMERDMTFFGVLDAVRGVYSVLGRQFQIEEGTVSFAGTPGINPDLDIRASNRVRTPDNQPLDIVATVGGSLLEPRVSLSTNSTFAISESDLVSYLIFGQPSYALASGEGAIARGTAQVFAGATANLAAGLFSSELGSVLARDGLPVNLDYLAITQGKNDPGGLQDWWMSTQVELGKYLTDDIFAGLQFRPFTENQGQDRLASVRLETRLSDRWTLEGYWEDRFLRRGLYGLRDQNLYEKVLGFLLYTEWGY
jgi:autotransporter translocation and assembly factor TamB